MAALGAVVAGQFGATIDERLAGQQLSPAAERIVNEAKERTLARADPDGLPAAEARVVSQAAEDASVAPSTGASGSRPRSSRSAALLGVVGIRNPRREVPCEGCPGGQLAGAPLEAARPRRAVPAPT